MPRKLTQEEFINKANKKHNFKFDYSKSVYINNTTKIIIICPIHGEFEQTPKLHIKTKTGCMRCGKNILSKLYSHTIEDFVEKAIKIHGKKYDYSKVNYINSKKKVTIICPIHGEFEQQAGSHIKGSGCEQCGTYAMSKLNTLTIDEFIQKAKKIHRNRYDYSLVNYVNNRIKVTIVCKDHGKFKQIPNTHLLGFGCKSCGIWKNKNKIMLYFIKAINNNKILYKIGVTSQKIKDRFYNELADKYNIELLYSKEFEKKDFNLTLNIESKIIEKYSNFAFDKFKTEIFFREDKRGNGSGDSESFIKDIFGSQEEFNKIINSLIKETINE